MIHINIFKDNDTNFQYIFVTTNNCRSFIQAIEYCFIPEDKQLFLDNLYDEQAPQELIDYVSSHDTYDSIFEFTRDFLSDIGQLVAHKTHNYYY